MMLLAIQVVRKQGSGALLSRNVGERVERDEADFSLFGIQKVGDEAYRQLMRTGEVNGLRLLSIDGKECVPQVAEADDDLVDGEIETSKRRGRPPKSAS